MRTIVIIYENVTMESYSMVTPLTVRVVTIAGQPTRAVS